MLAAENVLISKVVSLKVQGKAFGFRAVCRLYPGRWRPWKGKRGLGF